MSKTTFTVTVQTAAGFDSAYLFPGSMPHIVTYAGAHPNNVDFDLRTTIVRNGVTNPDIHLLHTRFLYVFNTLAAQIVSNGTDIGGGFYSWDATDVGEQFPTVLAGLTFHNDSGNSGYSVPAASYSSLTADALVATELSRGQSVLFKMIGYTGNDTLRGTFWHDSLDGGDGNDSLIGGDGNDTLTGGKGADMLVGGAGNDDYWIDSSKDRIVDTSGTSDGVYTTISFTLPSNLEFLTGITTGTGSKGLSLTGSSKANGISGTEHNDTMKGMAGNDTLAGLAGKDTIYGGTGRDAFFFTMAPTAASLDTIRDFAHGSDKIYLWQSMFPMAQPLPSGVTLPTGWFHASSNGKAADGDDRILYNTKNGYLSYDQDGNGSVYAPIHFVTLWKDAHHHPSLSASDFILI